MNEFPEIEEIRKRLIHFKGHWNELTCDKLPYSWISTFARKEVPSPGYNRVINLIKNMDKLKTILNERYSDV